MWHYIKPAEEIVENNYNVINNNKMDKGKNCCDTNNSSCFLHCIQKIYAAENDWLTVFGFNAALTAKVISCVFLVFSQQY